MIALDLYCGAGGASMGMWRTGLFDRIVGVDIAPQPDYPFEFVQCSALDYDIDALNPDFIWASPPCQLFTSMAILSMARNNISEETWKRNHPDLVDVTRQKISKYPWWAIENVPGAPIRSDIVLEGGNVGIPNLKRRRLFETSWQTVSPKPFQVGPALIAAYGHGNEKQTLIKRKKLGLNSNTTVEEIQEAFEVDWCSRRKSLNQMIPTQYATYVLVDATQRGFGDKPLDMPKWKEREAVFG